MAKSGNSMLMRLVMVLSFALGGLCDYNGGQFRAFYFVQQWLGSYCNQRGTRCCYPPTKLSPDFTIYGLWPYYTDGSFPYNCPAGASYDVAPLKPMQPRLDKAWPSFTCPLIGRKFWVHEWNKHGTCSMSVLSEMAYLEAALTLKNKVPIFQALARAGIRPDNRFYSLKSIKTAIAQATGFHPWINCNRNAQGNSQIWQVTLCADRSGTRLVQCPYIPSGRNGCDNYIQFPSYY